MLGIGDLADRSVPVEKCVATLHGAMDFGLNLIDTAPGYEDGYSETIVGAALRGRREGVFVIDKIDHLDQPVGPQVEASLKTLGMGMVDLFVFHAVSEMAQWDKLSAPGGGMEELGRCVTAGKARFRGISSHHPEVLKAALASGLCDVVMFPIGPFCDSRYVQEVLPWLAKKAWAQSASRPSERASSWGIPPATIVRSKSAREANLAPAAKRPKENRCSLA